MKSVVDQREVSEVEMSIQNFLNKIREEIIKTEILYCSPEADTSGKMFSRANIENYENERHFSQLCNGFTIFTDFHSQKTWNLSWLG